MPKGDGKGKHIRPLKQTKEGTKRSRRTWSKKPTADGRARKETIAIDGLKPQHKLAAEIYMSNGFRQNEAMIDAGFTKSTANSNAHVVFGRPEVLEYIKRRMEERAQKYEVTADRVVNEMAKIAFFSLGDAIVEAGDDGTVSIDVTKLSKDQRAALAEFTIEEYTEGRGEARLGVRKVKLKPFDKKAALDSLMRYLGLFNDKVELTGTLSLVERIQKGRERVLNMKRQADGNFSVEN